MSTSLARIGRRWWPVRRSTRAGATKPSGSQTTPARYGPASTVDGMSDAGPDDAEPLEIVPHLVPIEAHDPDAGGASVVRLFFQPGDRTAAPEVDLADVVVFESWDRVAIALVRRSVAGTGADGTVHGVSLVRRAPVSLDVALAEPLGTRPLLDA